jgi:hypothetical protein
MPGLSSERLLLRAVFLVAATLFTVDSTLTRYPASRL